MARLLAVCVVALAVPAWADPLPKTAETWGVISIAGKRVGYSHETVTWEERDGKRVRISETEDLLSLARAGQKVQIRGILHVEETAAGALIRFSQELQMPPSKPTRLKGQVSGEVLSLETEVAGQKRTVEQIWNPSFLGPNAEVRLLRDKPLKPGESRSFEMFDLATGAVITVKQTAAAKSVRETLLDGSSKTLLKVHTDMGPLNGDTFVDDAGRPWREVSNVLGGVTKDYVPRETALASLKDADLDLTTALMVRVPPIKNVHTAARIVYRISIAGEEASKLIPAGGTQAIKRLDGGAIELTVSEGGIPPLPAATALPDAKYREANSYIQSDDPLVRKHAETACGKETSPWKQVLLMEKWVAKNLTEKNFSTVFASASEVAKSLSGDCTEHAVLLCAMCRAKKIPSRVAMGLVYVPRETAFVGHAWTEVHINGVWLPLDATLGQGRVGPDHIKMSDAALSTEGAAFQEFLPLMNALGKMRIEVLSTMDNTY